MKMVHVSTLLLWSVKGQWSLNTKPQNKNQSLVITNICHLIPFSHVGNTHGIHFQGTSNSSQCGTSC
ncbi:hypothetical protein VNO78_28156 [Psophocarpus tetragonolobus]|uniref:Secreted protein n=1 Tax=Psophocarpus tetragonolobus TaxID=3891 RepID=A0AAN9XD05_PSOTE